MRYMMLIALLLAIPGVVNAQAFTWEQPPQRGDEVTTFDTAHHEEYVLSALWELTGKQAQPDATRDELAAIVLDLLDDLPMYGQRQVAMVPPPIPNWLLKGYSKLNPTSVSHSRYLDSVIAGELAASADLGALYAFWCVYDAEWFSLARHADHKAWLSAVLLHYPPAWIALEGEMEGSLHSRLVVPLQTPDEPYRELDNWINNFTKHSEAFAKPKVRDALVQELTARGGLESDMRFFEDAAYGGPTPTGLGLSERQFYLMAALSLEFFQEIYAAEPTTKQMLHFREYFIGTYHYHAR